MPPEYKTYHIKSHLQAYEYEQGGFRVVWAERVQLVFEDLAVAQRVYDEFHSHDNGVTNKEDVCMLKRAWQECGYEREEWKSVQMLECFDLVTKSVSRRILSQTPTKKPDILDHSSSTVLKKPSGMERRADGRPKTTNAVAHRMISHALGISPQKPQVTRQSKLADTKDGSKETLETEDKQPEKRKYVPPHLRNRTK